MRSVLNFEILIVSQTWCQSKLMMMPLMRCVRFPENSTPARCNSCKSTLSSEKRGRRTGAGALGRRSGFDDVTVALLMLSTTLRGGGGKEAAEELLDSWRLRTTATRSSWRYYWRYQRITPHPLRLLHLLLRIRWQSNWWCQLRFKFFAPWKLQDIFVPSWEPALANLVQPLDGLTLTAAIKLSTWISVRSVPNWKFLKHQVDQLDETL